jgi:hypothetical protein
MVKVLLLIEFCVFPQRGSFGGVFGGLGVCALAGGKAPQTHNTQKHKHHFKNGRKSKQTELFGSNSPVNFGKNIFFGNFARQFSEAFHGKHN